MHALSDWIPHHVRQVQRIAGWLFEALHEYHGLGPAERRLLEAAAYLHDVGYPTDPARHHKVSARIVRANLGAPFTDDDVQTIALLTRYHRKGGPKLKHRRFAALDGRRRDAVRWLAGILRVADGLDRSHVAAVRGVAAARIDGRLELRVRGSGAPLDEDLAGAVKKRDVLERALGITLVVREG